jgi:transglutaminase-like putative cysteine protease
MRIRIAHQTRYLYDRPVRAMQQVLRLTPRDHDGQHVIAWRLEPSAEGCLVALDDVYGNRCHHFAADHPVSDFSLSVTGEVETQDTAGVVRGTVERFPDLVYLRDTDLTSASEEIRTFARDVAGGAGDPLSALHRLLAATHEEITFDTEPTDATTSAADAFAARRGVCQDLTHVFLAAARQLSIPARYVSGYFLRGDGVTQQEAGHAWAEAKVTGLGWVGFDPANCISTTDAHVRVAVGLDYLAAAPIRGSRRGGGNERLDVTLRVDTAQRQTQS